MRFLAVLLLVVAAPLIAEVLWGSTPYTAAVSGYLLSLPIYGAGALLIRELVRHRGCGWVSILLLGLGYGVIEEGLLLQDLFWPTQSAPYSAAGSILGIDTIYTVMVIPLHAVWSVAIPILLVEVLIPVRRNEPYLGRLGLAITGLAYCLGVAVYWLWARVALTNYHVSPLLLGGCLVVVAALAVAALVILPPRSDRPTDARTAPSPWAVFAVAGLGGFLSLALLIRVVRTSPAFDHGILLLIPVLGATAIAGVAGWLLWTWSGRRAWNDLHRLALVSGLLLAHTGYGIFDIAQTTVDREGLAGLGIAMTIGLLVCVIWVPNRLRARTS